YGGDFDQKDVRAGCRVHLPVLVEGALVFFADPHAAISDGIIGGAGVECDATVRARIGLEKRRMLHRPLLEIDDTVQGSSYGPRVEAGAEDCARGSVELVVSRTGMAPREAYMLLSVIGELRIGTSPRPVMAARLIIPQSVLSAAAQGRA